MKARHIAMTAVLLFGTIAAGFPQGTAFTYQGRLNQSGAPASGTYDFLFSVWSAQSGPSQLTTPFFTPGVVVSNGLFTVLLDFGDAPFSGPPRSLEIGVSTNGAGNYSTLVPRQALSPTPYAITARNITGVVPSGGISGTYSGTVAFNNTGNTFAGNGSALSNVNAAAVGGMGPSNLWRLGGNSGNPDTRLGTLDSEPLRIIAGNRRVLQAESASRRSGIVYTYFGPNLLSGSDANVVSNGVLGATIAGGGETLTFGGFQLGTYPNIISDDFGTIGGGLNNRVGNTNADFADAQSSTIAGGSGNIVLVSGGTIGGGSNNKVAGDGGAVAGGNNNAANNYNTTVSGGANNIADANASAIAGGSENYAGGDHATVVGGQGNVAGGVYSLAAGARAKAIHDGSFVWADWEFADFTSTARNQFNVRASGGVRLETAGAGVTLDGQPLLTGNYSNPVAFNNAASTFNGNFTGNGSGLTSLSLDSLVATSSNLYIVGWGNDYDREATAPHGLHSAIAVAAGLHHSLAVKADGTVLAWGWSDHGQTNVPAGLNNVVAVAAGATHSLALKADGTVVAWGQVQFGPATVPAGLNNVVAIVAGDSHNLALKADGTVVGWGHNNAGEATVPVGLANVQMIAAGGGFSLALKADGTVVGWGSDWTGQVSVPAGLNNVVGIACGDSHSLAVKSDGTVVAWGSNLYGNQAVVPAGLNNVAKVAAGDRHSLALKRDGTVVAWGENAFGPTNVPVGLDNVVVLAQGCRANHVLALRRQARSPVALLGEDNTFDRNVRVDGSATFNSGIQVHGLSAFYDNVDIQADLSVRNLKWSGAETHDSALELGRSYAVYGFNTPYIDFHFSVERDEDYNVRLINDADGRLTCTGNLAFGARTRQMLNLWGNVYGIGVQSSVLYSRCDGNGLLNGFAWYKGGTHNDGLFNAGGGTELMRLNALGLTVNGAFVSGSDRNTKAGFELVDPKVILQKVATLPITRWHYTNDVSTPHIGPMAQDFQAAFSVGPDDKHIATVDADGVALAAIQGLNQVVTQQRSALRASEKKIEALEKRVDQLEMLIRTSHHE